MSRIAKKPIAVPEGVTVELAGNTIKISGKLGLLARELRPEVKVEMRDEDDKKLLQVSVQDETDKKQKAYWGLFYRLILGMIKGVKEGYSKQLELVGIGYKAQSSGSKLILDLGFSHQIDFSLPEGISAKIEKNIITLSGINKELLGNVAADIRKIRKPEPYKGKGIRYVGEVVRKKAGKTAVKTA